MSYTVYTPNITKTNENGYSWYKCNCCPYGYHIDLDFVRYCESISQLEADRTGSIKRRKDRRRQRQSMEVLLGITPPVLTNLEQNYKSIDEQESPKITQKQQNAQQHFSLIQDGFDDAVSDFERTLQRSKNKLSNNLPDVTAVSEVIRRIPSNSSMSSASGSSMTVLQTTNEAAIQDFDAVSIESYGLSPVALQNIREQMAISLERTRQLEDQVKLIPELKDQLSTLKEENRRLILRLKAEETNRLNTNTVNVSYLTNISSYKNKSQSFTNIDNLDSLARRGSPPPPPPRKDIGVMCGVLTRNVGVGHQNPHTKSVSTTTLNGIDLDNGTDKWFNEKYKFMNNNVINNYSIEKVGLTKGTQTILSKEKRDAAVQSVEVKKILTSKTAQTIEIPKQVTNVGVTVSPKYSDFQCQKYVECYSVGCSDDSITDTVCEKCKSIKISIAVGPDNNEDSHTIPTPISLASLMVPRSKSFNLGEDKLNLTTRSRTVGSQYEPNNYSRSSQTSINTQSKYSQHEYKLADKATQFESNSVSKNTDTKDLVMPKKHVACEAKEIKNSKSVGSDPISEMEKSIVCSKCQNKEKEDMTKKDGSPTPSRIPRPQIPTTPVENRKFRRQDTYTKIYSTTDKLSPTSPVSSRLSGLDLSSKTISSETSPLDKVKQNFKFPEVASTSDHNGTLIKVQVHESTLPVSETTSFHTIGNQNRNKAVPSKEMQGAMKVLNDSLQKSPSKNLKNQSAIDIVQQEWFKISSSGAANPLDVEDYLDAFEDMSSLLLQYIVNMTDISGNTAMHYAVSHGNFDVVSILLDSKVCDINKPNKAGYTSVMLVSLAEVKSATHASVVRRLFQLADVNIRARQHGQTALMLAVSHGRLDMVKMLLEAGADINIQDEDGSTALMCAAEHGHMEIVKHFLSHPDCDSSITDVDGSTALKIAMEAGHRHIGVLLYAHERNYQKTHGTKLKKTKSSSPKTPSSPLPIRSSHRALTDTKTPK